MNRKLLMMVCALSAAALLGLSGSVFASDIATTAAAEVSDEPLNLERGTIVSNISFLGNSLSGLTLEDAVEKVNSHLSNMLEVKYCLRSTEDESLEADLSAEDFDLTYDETVAEKSLLDKVLTGNLLERYKMAKDYQRMPYEVQESVTYDAEKIEAFLQENTTAWTQEPMDASVSGKSGRLVVTPGQNGRVYSYEDAFAKLKSDLDSLAVDHPVYEIPVTETVTEPSLTTERAESFTIIGSCTTEYPTVTTETLANREHNLELSLQYLSGRRYAPGEEISALVMYNGPEITASKGYLPAATFADGGHSAAVGGGICQTTTTLYNAVLEAELDVVYRNHHSLLVAYVEASHDAMVSAPGSDFKFRNSSSDYIFIEGYIDKKAETMTIYIIGHEDQDPGHKVRYETEILNMVMPSIELIDNPEWPLGFSNGGRKFALNGTDGPQAGITSRLWKITSENGVDVSREMVSQDTYKPARASYIVAPDTIVNLEFSSRRNSCYLQLNTTFLDGTSVGADPVRWSDSERISFNERMSALVAAKGYTWPDTGNVISIDNHGTRQQLWPDPNLPTESESESEAAVTPGSETTPTAPATETVPPTSSETPPPSEGGEVPPSGEGEVAP